MISRGVGGWDLKVLSHARFLLHSTVCFTDHLTARLVVAPCYQDASNIFIASAMNVDSSLVRLKGRGGETILLMLVAAT